MWYENAAEAVAEYAAKGFIPVETNLASSVVTMRQGDKDPYAALFVAIWEKDGELQVEEY